MPLSRLIVRESEDPNEIVPSSCCCLIFNNGAQELSVGLGRGSAWEKWCRRGNPRNGQRLVYLYEIFLHCVEIEIVTSVESMTGAEEVAFLEMLVPFLIGAVIIAIRRARNSVLEKINRDREELNRQDDLVPADDKHREKI